MVGGPVGEEVRQLLAVPVGDVLRVGPPQVDAVALVGVPRVGDDAPRVPVLLQRQLGLFGPVYRVLVVVPPAVDPDRQRIVPDTRPITLDIVTVGRLAIDQIRVVVEVLARRDAWVVVRRVRGAGGAGNREAGDPNRGGRGDAPKESTPFDVSRHPIPRLAPSFMVHHPRWLAAESI